MGRRWTWFEDVPILKELADVDSCVVNLAISKLMILIMPDPVDPPVLRHTLFHVFQRI